MIVGWKANIWIAWVLLCVAMATGDAQCPLPARMDWGSVRREAKVLVDRGTGQRWTFSDLGQRPGAPRRLHLSNASSQELSPGEGTQAEGNAGRIIRAGDRLEVLDCRAGVEAHLEATALKPASMGDRVAVRSGVFEARLTVVALAPGKVVLEPENGAVR